MLKNTWKRLGILLQPNKSIWWMSDYCGPTFADVREDYIDLYVVGRDNMGISRIGIAVLDKKDPSKILSISKDPVLDIGEVGCFDESGVSYPWLIRDGDELKLYYGGWQAGGIGGFQVNIGLARYNAHTKVFERVSRAPILPRINEEPICTGSLGVYKTKDHWTMWYTCFEQWKRQEDNSYKHYYHIKSCSSEDGIHWERPGNTAITFKTDLEHVICKPMIIEENNRLRMWLSCRGDSYRIGYAESLNGQAWTRKDDEFQWSADTKPITGFDDIMQEYAYIFDIKGNRYMTYNGNGYGKMGVGLALLI